VERGTRWAVFERNDVQLRSRVAAQVHLFLAGFEVDGAFQAQEGDEACFVVCDERLNTPADIVEGRLRLLFGFATDRPGEFHAVLLTHLPGASRMRPVSVNRLATAQRRVGQEIETQILRSLVAR
jgi:phage tail sheath protein FI